jgi:hypothetical protein
MMAKRKYIRDSTKLAAMICLRLELPHWIAKALTESEVLALVEWDHYPQRYVDGGPDAHWNLQPLLAVDHKVKTAKDAGERAHERRVRRSVDEHRQRMLLKGMGKKPVKRSRWPKRRMRR